MVIRKKRDYQKPSEVIGSYRKPAEVIRSNQKLSEAIRSYLKPSDASRSYRNSISNCKLSRKKKKSAPTIRNRISKKQPWQSEIRYRKFKSKTNSNSYHNKISYLILQEKNLQEKTTRKK